MKTNQILWLSRHPLSPAQKQAIAEIHGERGIACDRCGGIGLGSYDPGGVTGTESNGGPNPRPDCPDCFGYGWDVPPVVHDPRPFEDLDDFLGRTREARRQGSFPYVVAPAHMTAASVADHGEFGMFENDPTRRADGQFGLLAVWHCQVRPGAGSGWHDGPAIVRVWTNPDPASDAGDALVPVARKES